VSVHLGSDLARTPVIVRLPCLACKEETLHRASKCIHCGTLHAPIDQAPGREARADKEGARRPHRCYRQWRQDRGAQPADAVRGLQPRKGRVLNFYKHHIGDYDADTSHLSWLEDMAYTRLMRLYYRREQPIPAEVAQACRLVRATSKQERDAVEANEFGQEREAKAENEKERQRRHREDRRKLFEELRCHDIVPPWDTKMDTLRELLRNATKTDLSRVTGVTETQTATAIQTPQPDSRYQKPELQRGERTSPPAPDPPPNARSARATRIPDDFELTPERRQVAQKHGLEPARTHENFVNYWKSEGGQRARKVDWDATWAVWCSRETKQTNGHAPPAPRKTRFEEAMDRIPGVHDLPPMFDE
jgi:hypothetical protein